MEFISVKIGIPSSMCSITRSKIRFQKIYDPRTGRYDQPTIVDKVLSRSELLKRIKKYTDAYLQTSQAAAAAILHADGGHPVGPSQEDVKRLDPYVNNELAMSFIAAGAGVPFIAFLQPYLSLKHETTGGDPDKALIRSINDRMPILLPWLDMLYPALREKMAAAAAEHPSLHFVDLSLMFTHEQVFADHAHMRCEDGGLSMPGNEMIAARMADEIVQQVYLGKELPDWRPTHIEGTPHDWNDQAYLDANPDVAKLVAKGEFANGYAHYIRIGFLKGLQSGFPSWNENKYSPTIPMWRWPWRKDGLHRGSITIYKPDAPRVGSRDCGRDGWRRAISGGTATSVKRSNVAISRAALITMPEPEPRKVELVGFPGGMRRAISSPMATSAMKCNGGRLPRGSTITTERGPPKAARFSSAATRRGSSSMRDAQRRTLLAVMTGDAGPCNWRK